MASISGSVDQTAASASPGQGSGPTYRGPFAIMTTLFFMWGFMTVLNDILNAHFKDIANRSSAHENRPGEDVVAAAARCVAVNVRELGQDFKAARFGRHPFGIARNAFDGDTIA